MARFAALVPARGRVLDLACGAGRHVRLFLDRGHPVTAVDIDPSRLAGLGGHARLAALDGHAGLEVIAADLEGEAPWPLGARRFAGIVVTNYLHRPLLPAIVGALAPGGALIYETFAAGNERFGKPRNPDHLLRPGELLKAVRGRLVVVAYEDLEIAEPKPAMVQRIVAVNRG